ncbi:MAG: amino acid kinase [Pseudomonadota bacterium]|nr:amino acid kinase [Pseudomonadota bacterium]
MWVVKIGGSLAYAAELPAWLAALALQGGGRAVIVPGGGPFADLVRRAQAHQGYADTSAHAMALLAMSQYGLMMAGIEGRLVAATGLSQIREALATGRVPVWIPGSDGAPGVPASWEVSSDSLALWVAGQMGATDLALVKSRAPSPGIHRAPDLSAQGSLDAAFPGALACTAVEAWWLGRTDHRAIGPIVRDAARPETRIAS